MKTKESRESRILTLITAVSILLVLFIILAGSFVSAHNSRAEFSLGSFQLKEAGKFSYKSDESGINLTGNFVITGIGMGMQYNPDRRNVETLGAYILNPIKVTAREIYSNGNLGPEISIIRGKERNIDKKITLPEGYVMTGWGARVKEGSDKSNSRISYLEVTARKIEANGSLGAERVFASDAGQTADASVKLDEGYIATYIGGRLAIANLNKASIGGKRLIISQAPPHNHAPSINFLSVQGIYEGDLFRITARANDIDNDALIITYSAPFNSSGYWQTQRGDAGSYRINITASDGRDSTSLAITLNVYQRPSNITNITNQTNQTNATMNTPPSLVILNNSITAYEMDFIQIGYIVFDQDNDNITITFSGLFNNSGAWQTSIGSAGNYRINITATDGKNSTMDFVNVTILARAQNITNQTNQTNNLPIIQSIDYDGEFEKDTFKINVIASDADNDSLIITYSAPFNSSGYWKTEAGDAGSYRVNVTVSDGKSETRDSIVVVVKEKEKDDNDLGDEQGRNKKDDGRGSRIIYAGEFQNNSLALNNRLYYSEDAGQNEVIALSSYGDESVSVADGKSSRAISLLAIILILVLLNIIAVIGIIRYRRK